MVIEIRIGAHMSIAKSIELAYDRGEETGCECMQIFTKSNRQWNAKPIPEENVKQLFMISTELVWAIERGE